MLINRRGLLAGAGLALALPGRALAAPLIGFTHGVASGDPSQNAVTLWTRYAGAGVVKLKAEVAADPDFRNVLRSGEAEASPANDSTARVRVDGLEPGRWLHYRFTAPNGEASPVGRTRTLPAAGVQRFRIAFFSCSNGPAGWFNAYAHAAARDDIDLAVHLGDYIYESGVVRADTAPTALSRLRELQPAGEILALADYRQRYQSYRADPDLAELHRRLPMIAVWDDHETSNDAWVDGAEGHDPKADGDWPMRKAAGMRAWHEWMPMGESWYGEHAIGDLATLFRLETRLIARNQQLNAELDPIVAAGGADLPTKLAAFRTNALNASTRTMLGDRQERWLAEGLSASVSSGARWQILAQQVIMGATKFPAASGAWVQGGLTPELEAEIARRGLLTKAGMPYSLDKWDGYPAARQRLYDAARTAKADLVTLTGDSHNAWAFDLADAKGRIGVEFAGQSVSSFGFERRFTGDAKRIAADFMAANPNLKWMDASQRGYVVLDITRDRIEAEYVFVPALAQRSATATGSRKLAVQHGARKLSLQA